MMTKPLFVFFGNEKLATGIKAPDRLILEAAVNAGFELEQAVTGKLSELKPHNAKIAVLAAYGRIIPQTVLDEFPLGIINIHPSLLPQYRGPTPIEQAMLDGAPKTGVSIMHLTAGMDEGPIYKQRTLSVTHDESKQSLTDRLQILGATLLEETLLDIYNGTLKSRQQPHPSRATYSRKISKKDGILDFSKSAVTLEREVRAFSDWPKSRTSLAGIDVVITSSHAVDLSVGKTGSVESSKKDGTIMIQTSDGCLSIDTLKPAGKSEMTAKAFLAGYGKKL